MLPGFDALPLRTALAALFRRDASKLRAALGVRADSQATARLLGRTTAGTGASEEISVGSGLSLVAGVLSGSSKIINVVEATPYTTYTSAADAGIYDDTIPQIGEGTALMSVSITPTSATSRLRVEFLGDFGVTSGGNHVVVAMFRDATAGAVAAGAVTLGLNTYMAALPLVYEAAAGSTAATTFSIRFSGSGTVAHVNGSGVARRLGGAIAATLRVTEIAA